MLPRATVCHTLCGFLVATLAWAGGGSGSVDDPYVISNVEELQAIQDDLAAHYVLGNDIDASGTALWNNGSGFAPIGPPADPFTGVLDGRGHAVFGLYIVRVYEQFVETLRNDTKARRFATSASRTREVYGDRSAGILVGRANLGTLVTLSSATGVLTLRPGSDDAKSGGLIGAVTNGARLEQCFSDVEVFASNRRQVGSLVGYLRGVEPGPTATISNSYAAGTVHGNGWKQGNLLGDADGSIVERCYSSGLGKALVGFDFRNPTISNSYWDAERGAPTSPYEGMPRTSAQMMRQATFVGWDFNNIWGIDEAVSYPFLRLEPTRQVSLAVDGGIQFSDGTVQWTAAGSGAPVGASSSLALALGAELQHVGTMVTTLQSQVDSLEPPLVVVDSAGQVVGSVLRATEGWAIVVREESDERLLLRIEPEQIQGYVDLWYESADCTGMPFIPDLKTWGTFTPTARRGFDYYWPMPGEGATAIALISRWRTFQGCTDLSSIPEAHSAFPAEVIPGVNLGFTPEFALQGGPFAN